MVENDAKGWYGNFSSAGRNSAEKYNLSALRNKKHYKRAKIRDFFSPQEPEPEYDDEDALQQVDIFSEDFPSKAIPNSPAKINKSKSESTLDVDRYKYHNKHLSEIVFGKKKEPNPPCTKYNPKMDIIWRKTITGPKWKTIKGRNNEVIIDNKQFYATYEDDFEHCPKKGFIDMNKQTMRSGFPVEHDLRIRYEKKFTPKPTGKLIKKTYKYSSQSSSSRRENLCNESNDNNNNISIVSFNQTKFPKMLLKKQKVSVPQSSLNTLKKKPKNFQRDNTAISNNTTSTSLEQKCLLVPDFKKTLSRDDINRVKSFQKINPPLNSPNINPVKSRPIMMVSYDIAQVKKKINKKFKGVDHSISYNLDKIFNKYNNHKPVSVPLFKNMTSRPMDDNPLPSFMRQMYTRAGANATTDKTLKMNHFAEGAFMTGYSSFITKKSFNKMINLSLLNNDSSDMNLLDTKTDNKGLSQYLSKSIKFYSKNYDELVSENQMNNFDRITLKGIKKNVMSSLPEKDLEKFMINFEKIDQDFVL